MDYGRGRTFFLAAAGNKFTFLYKSSSLSVNKPVKEISRHSSLSSLSSLVQSSPRTERPAPI